MSQTFKEIVPCELVKDLIEKLGSRISNKIVINLDSFKKGMYKNTISEFLELCKPYYHSSKQHFLTRKQTYNTFITVLRQICNHNNIVYTSQIKYNNSTYNINYYFYW